MEITSLGHSCFKLRSRSATLITDPFNPKMLGVKLPSLSADIVTISHQHEDHNNLEAIGEHPVLIAGPGEYEVKGVRILGIASYHDQENGKQKGKNIVYRILMDGISLVHCGDLGHKLDDRQIELLEGVDILMIPVGGVFTVSPQIAAEIASKLEPKIIIPMHYNDPKISQEHFGSLSYVEVFLKEMGKENVTSQAKLVVTKDKLPVETTVIVLE